MTDGHQVITIRFMHGRIIESRTLIVSYPGCYRPSATAARNTRRLLGTTRV